MSIWSKITCWCRVACLCSIDVFKVLLFATLYFLLKYTCKSENDNGPKRYIYLLVNVNFVVCVNRPFFLEVSMSHSESMAVIHYSTVLFYCRHLIKFGLKTKSSLKNVHNWNYMKWLFHSCVNILQLRHINI